jgi:hypothetical protein
MITLRVVRHDRHDQVLAECQSAAVPTSGEVLQLDTVNDHGEPSRPSTLWRVVAVTLHVPSLVPDFAMAAERILSESQL